MPQREHRSKQARKASIRALRRQLILDAAKQVFKELGIEGASLRTIAAAAGCTTGAIYPHFSKKEEIYAALLDESLGALEAAVRRAVKSARSPSENLRNAIMAYYEYFRRNPDDLALGLYLFRGLKPMGLTPELNQRLNAKLLGVLALIGNCLAALGGLDEREHQFELAGVFNYLTGLLIAERTGRIKVMGQDARTLLETYIDHLATRLENASGRRAEAGFRRGVEVTPAK